MLKDVIAKKKAGLKSRILFVKALEIVEDMLILLESFQNIYLKQSLAMPVPLLLAEKVRPKKKFKLY